MAKTKISEFSATPGNNTEIDGINIAEGCAPSGINDAIRELMAQLKDWQAGTSNDPYVVGSSGSLTLSYGTANGVPYLNGSKVLTSGSALTFDGTNFATTGSVTSAGSSNSGNLAFTGTGNRITGDFTNATIASRVLFQTSTSNSGTFVGAIANGTVADYTGSGYVVWANSDTTNSNTASVVAFKNLEARISSGAVGAASFVPMTFYTGGSERMRVDTSGNVGIGTSSPTAKLEVYDATTAVARVTAGTEIFEIRNTGSEVRLAVVSADPMTFRTSNVEAMRIDSNGNVGIGNTAANVNDQVGAVRPLLVSKSDTSTTIAGSQAAIVIGNADTTTSNTSQLSFAAITGGSSTYFTSAAINCVFGARTNGQYPTGQLTFSTSTSLNSAPTEKMRIDSSGNVGIGTSSPSFKLDVTGGDSSTFDQVINGGRSANYAGSLLFKNSYWSSGAYGAAAIRGLDSGSSGGLLAFYTTTNGGGTTGVPAERARIDSSGNLLLATTGSGFDPNTRIQLISPSGGNGIAIRTANNGNYGAYFLNASGTTVGGIVINSGGTAYNTTSDYRLKENVQPMAGALAKVATLKPCTYTWKSDGSDGQGFIAHELAEVVPDCVTGEKDAVDADGNPKYQGIDTSFLVATLTAAIQELKAINDAQAETITALTARVTALESN